LKKLCSAAGAITALCLYLLSTHTYAIDWPQQVTASEGTITVYQPQPETLEGNRLIGRAAMSLALQDSDDQIFGTFWFDARLETDRDTDTAVVSDFMVTQVRWPDSKDAAEQRFTAIVQSSIPSSGFEISLERLATSLATAELEQKSLDDLNNDPPAILFRDTLAVLLMYDGEPRYSTIENSSYQRVINTPIVVVKDKRGHHYATNGTLWYESSGALGPWAVTNSPPQDLVKVMPAPDEEPVDWPTPPEIVVATEPTELIVTDGAPEWTPLASGKVLYVSNTESPWLRDIANGNMYLLLSGRWYRSRSQDGPWAFVPQDELPASFADIPPASDIGGLRTSVAGTPEAEEAVLDAQIPQTAAISRDRATLEVTYDGKPKFEAISGTSVSYAVNTATQVLEIDKRFYAVDDGVWFTSANATGPWVVADKLPKEEIAKIPPSSPMYNTTYVNIYESTPEVVYVGYTPGYMWSFPYYGVPVYGSGWYYRPYPGPWYYPRPPTWGLHVGYNPWTGWNFGVSWSNGFFSFGMTFGGGYPYHRGGWYGGGYRGPTVINTGDINIGNNINVGNRTAIGDKIRRGDTHIDRGKLKRDNLYNRPENLSRKADRQTVKKDFQRATAKRDLKNNVYADREGKVHRNVDNQWQSRDAGAWKRSDALNQSRSNRDLNRPDHTSSHDRYRDLHSAHSARGRATHMERSRPMPSRGMSRGGGRSFRR